jgi:outer membrane immunogenic protein
MGASMTKVAVAIAVIAALVGTPVLAADMAVKAPPPAAPPAPIYSWTGFYVGVDGGGAWTDGTSTMNPIPSPAAWNRLPDSFDLRTSGGLLGMYAGYNWQFSPTWLIGIEGDWSHLWNNASASATDVSFAGVPFVGSVPTSMSRDLDWLATLRGRVGFLPSNNVLLYATGGVAWGDVHYTASLSSVPPGTLWNADMRVTETGFVVGGGLEWMVAHNVILRAEYLFHRLNGDSVTVSGVPANFPGFLINYTWNRFDVNVLRGGVSYKF